MPCGLLIFFLHPAVSRVFHSPGFSKSRFVRVQLFLSPGFSRSRFFRVQVFQRPGFSGSTFFRVRVQGLGPRLRRSSEEDVMLSFLNPRKGRGSRLQIFFKIGVLKNFANFSRKHRCWSLFLIKFKKQTPTQAFSLEIL